MLRLIYLPAANADLDAIYEFIEPENARRAFSFVQEIRKSCQILMVYPQLGVARDDLGEAVRIYPVRGRIVIAYDVTDEAIQIIRIFYGGQDYEAILRDGVSDH